MSANKIPISLGHGARIEQLDGVRAIAIALVLSVHFWFFRLGWTGVHLFFVLSGLLITGILRRARNDRFYWAPFYIKRATRILPPVLVAVLGAAVSLIIPWRKIALYYIFFAANFAEARYVGESKTIGVMWSLAVEEQFYFLWPFAVRFLNRTQLIRLLVAILAAEPILRALATPRYTTCWPIFLLTPFQIDGLAAGCLLSLLLESESSTKWLRTWCTKLLILSVAVFSICSFLPSFHREANSILFNSVGYSLIVAVAVFFIAYVLLRPTKPAGKVLALPSVVFIGTISFGIYLFQPLILELSGRFLQTIGFYHQRAMSPVTIAVIVAVSWFSYQFYERPVVRWGHRKAAERQESDRYNDANLLVESSQEAT
jgi:peptidoglycan/LPS O-acetylase OafA/YrhL